MILWGQILPLLFLAFYVIIIWEIINLNMPNKKRKLKIGFDFDGVIIDHTKNKILIAKKYGFDISAIHVAGHRLKKIVPEEIYVKIQDLIYGPLTLNAPVMPTAAEAMLELSKIADLSLVSRRAPDHRQIAIEWLNQNLPDVFSRGQIFFVDHDPQKKDICKTLGITVFIDDKISVLQYMPDTPHRYWFDQYNSSDDLGYQGLIVVKSWKDFLAEIKRLSLAQPFDR